MKLAKVVLATGTLILLAIAIWMQVAQFSVQGGWVRGGRWHKDTITPGAVFFFTAVLASMYIAVAYTDRKQKQAAGKRSQRNYYP